MKNTFEEDEIPATPRGSATADDMEVSEEEGMAFNISQLIENIPYPATKEDIMDYANDQGVEEDVLDMIDQLPDTTYNNPADVSQAFGENAETI